MNIDNLISLLFGIFIGANFGIIIAGLMGANHYDDMSY